MALVAECGYFASRHFGQYTNDGAACELDVCGERFEARRNEHGEF